MIRWVSSVPSRFQGGYCHESGVECMFPAARQSAFERLRAQVRRICFVCARRPVAPGCGARWTGVDTRRSRLSDKATAAGSIPYTPQCACGTARRRQRPAAHGWASGIGQYRDRTLHMGRRRQHVSNVSILFFPLLPQSPLVSSRDSLVGLVGHWFSHLRGTHGTRLAARRTEAAGRCESSGQRWQRRGEGEERQSKTPEIRQPASPR